MASTGCLRTAITIGELLPARKGSSAGVTDLKKGHNLPGRAPKHGSSPSHARKSFLPSLATRPVTNPYVHQAILGMEADNFRLS